ncbi:MAG: acetyltransferase [Bacteroidia bacterium]|nr:MAG: acetyltransferase [Bacteroidia bacterium]
MKDKTENIVLLGAGGHCKSVIDVLEHLDEYRIAGIVGMPQESGTKVLGYPVIGTDEDLDKIFSEYKYFHIALGFLRSPRRRIEIWKLLTGMGAKMPAIISPLAYVSRHAQIGSGSIVMHQALINASAVVGENVIINNKVLVEHDAFIGDHCHIATGAIINGGVKVGDASFVGSGAVTRQGANIEAGAFIKANSIVK